MKEKSLDVNYYINWYVNEFTKYFPGIYEKDELLSIISSRVEKVLCTDDISFDSAGEYLEFKKIVKVYSPEDEGVLFHEFTHALRSFYFPVNDPDSEVDMKDVLDGTADIMKKLGLADEGMIEYITKLYLIRKRTNNNDYMFIKIPKSDKYNTYELSALTHSNLNLFTTMIFGHDFTKEYLKGKNIYNYVFQMFLNYLNALEPEKDNDMLALRLGNIFITGLAGLGEEHQIENGYANAIKDYVQIEKFIKSFAYMFGKSYPKGKVVSDFINRSLLYEKPIHAEDLLLAAILNEPSKLYTYEMLENLSIDYLLDADSSQRN